jgi:hypothetical protein
MKPLLIIAGALLLASCGGEQYGDLKEELARSPRPAAEGEPPVKPYEPVPHEAASLPDPFGPARSSWSLGRLPGPSAQTQAG